MSDGDELEARPDPAEELAARAREAAQAQDRYLRTLAEFENYRKRTARDRDDWRRQAQADLVREILPALDNFDRALSALPAAGDGGFRTGVELIHKDFLKALERVGVRPVSALGERFAPQRHEAVGRVEGRPGVPDQTVVDETLRGYLFHDRVLRPAQVVVAVEPSEPPVDPVDPPRADDSF
jgi:molecular chaperone GrpE